MQIARLVSVTAVLASLLGCATHEYTERDRHDERERREEWRREASAHPPPCPGAFWEDGREYPDGRWDPGHWRCPEHTGSEHR